jgi:hypothetical protein
MPRAILRPEDFAFRHLFVLWTDALCFCEMAKQAPEKYLESMCIRHAVLSAWTSMEMACVDALGIKRLGGKKAETFIERLSRALEKRGKPPLDLATGVWCQLNDVIRENRNIFAHSGVESPDKCFPELSIADNAIKWIQFAIHDIYARVGKTCPRFIAHDHIGGWTDTRNTNFSSFTVSEAGVDIRSPDIVKITLVAANGREAIYHGFPIETTDAVLQPWVDNLLTGKPLNFSFTKIRVYRGANFVEHEFDAR